MKSGHDPAYSEADAGDTQARFGVRVYSHGESLRGLISGLADIGDDLRRERGFRIVFLQRGWLHGAHIDLLAAAESGRPVPWPQVDAEVESLAATLSPATRAEPEYLEKATELGALEQVSGPYLPLFAHRTVAAISRAEANPWRGELGALREGTLARMFTPIRLSQVAGAGAALAVAEAFAALADEHPWGIGGGSFSYRSHAEAFLHSYPRFRPKFAERLRADHDELHRIVDAVLSGKESYLASRWRGAFAYCLGRFDAETERGTLSEQTLAEAGPRGESEGWPDAGLSEFHAEVAATGITERAGDWFTGFRLLINLFYRQLPLLEISPVQRFYLCYALAEVVEECTGLSWRERLARVTA